MNEYAFTFHENQQLSFKEKKSFKEQQNIQDSSKKYRKNYQNQLYETINDIPGIYNTSEL